MSGVRRHSPTVRAMDVKRLLRDLGLRPRKGLGQNFLVDEAVLRRIIDVAEVAPGDSIVEVGAGLGTLTEALIEHGGRVIAVEVDERLAEGLRSRLGDGGRLTIFVGDILEAEIDGLLRDAWGAAPAEYKVVANIPYYITSALLRHLLESSPRPDLIVLMVQREVAQRIVAQPGDMSLLAVSVQFFSQPSIAARVPARAFYPAPKVDSAIVRIKTHAHLMLPPDEVEPFFRVVRAGFAQRRKQLHNALAHSLALPPPVVSDAMKEAGIEKRTRAQALSVEQWIALYRAFL